MRNLAYVSRCDYAVPRPEVLIVEDDPDVRLLLRLSCEAAGYAVQTRADGVDALAWLRASANASIVVLDYRMPRLDGWGVLKAVAADSALAGAGHVYILVTADAATLPPEFSDLLGEMSVRVAAKPVDLVRLHALLAEAERRITVPPGT